MKDSFKSFKNFTPLKRVKYQKKYEVYNYIPTL